MIRIFVLYVTLLMVPYLALAQSAEYRVTFTGTWTSEDSLSYPLSAHFTDLVGATHLPGEAIWQRGGFASPGVEEVAETGNTRIILDELSALHDSGTSGQAIILDSLFGLPNSTSVEIQITEEQSHITLISMVAPSPDWFVGVSDLSLRNNNAWVEDLTIDLHPYDAGTEEGNEFTLSNDETSPFDAIQFIGESPFFLTNPVIGQLRFELLTVIETSIPEPSTPIVPPVRNDNKAALTPVTNILLEGD